MKAIVTKFHGPTDTKGSRISASDSDGNRVFLSKDHSLSDHEAHGKAARALLDKMGWQGELIGGYVKDGMVWVFANSSYRA